MHDLTEARPVTETVTASDIYDLGHKQGVQSERIAVLQLLNNQLMLNEGDTADTIWTLAKIIDAGHHRIHA